MIRSVKLIGRQKSFRSGDLILQNEVARNFYYLRKRRSYLHLKSVGRISVPRNRNKNIENNIPDDIQGFAAEDLDSESFNAIM